jgi:hypothetical protein
LIHASYTSDETFVYLKKTARHMRWHKEGLRENDQVMVHPSDSEAWKTLDNFDPDFTRDARNVRIGLATNGFTPYNSSAASTHVGPYLLFRTTFHLLFA